MGVELLNPWMLWGTAALAAPLLVHLLTRGTRQSVWFPTIEFLRRSLARHSRLMRLRHLLLLLLRILAIVLLAVGFARPVLKLPFQRLAKQRGRTTTVIALDLSLSMAYTGSGTTPLSRAKAEAEQILRSLHRGDRANLLFVSASPYAAAPQPTTDFDLLRDELDRAAATLEEADFGAAIEQAVTEAGADQPENPTTRELHIISDFQRTNWAGVRPSAVPADVALYLVDVDSETKANTAVTQMRTRPATLRVGDVAEVACEVANYGPDARQVPVDLTLHGSQPVRQQVLAPAFGSATALFRVRLDRVGVQEAVARIPADALEADNTRYLAMPVREALSVLLLTDEDPRDSKGSAFYLERALNPYRGTETSVRVTALNAAKAAQTDLRQADVVLVSDLYDLSSGLARKLTEYLAARGCVFYFLGQGQAPAQLSLLNSLSKSGPVAPFTVTDLIDVHGRGRGYVTLTDARFESPLLKLLRNLEEGDLGRFRFHKFWLVTDVAPHAEVLLQYEDRTIAAARQRVGAGSFVLCNFSPQPDFSDIIKHDLFPPLLHELIKGALAEETAPADFHVGHGASVTIPGLGRSPSLTFLNPSGDRLDARWQAVGEDATVFFEGTPLPGFYVVQSGSAKVAATPVNVSPDESDLRELSGADLAAKQQMEHHSYAVHADVDPTYVQRLRSGRELWPMLIVAALLVAVGEQVLAYVLRTR